MNLKYMFRFGAAAALLLSGIVVAGATHACPATDINGNACYPGLITSNTAYWGTCVNLRLWDNSVGGQACGSGNTLYASLAPESTAIDAYTQSLPGDIAGCVDAYAYSGNNLKGFVEETTFGASATTQVTGVPVTVKGSLYGCGIYIPTGGPSPGIHCKTC